MTAHEDFTDLVKVRLVNLSLSALRESSQHHDELMREFTLIALHPADDAASQVPSRLVALTEELTIQFKDFSVGPNSVIEAAIVRSNESIDVTWRVPRQVGSAATEFAALLEEADDYCRRGDLLTLATPPRVAAFRRWFLDEFIAQIAGSDPTPWVEH